MEYFGKAPPKGPQSFSNDREFVWARFVPKQPELSGKAWGKAVSTEHQAEKIVPSTHTSGWSNSFPGAFPRETRLTHSYICTQVLRKSLYSNRKINMAEQLLQKLVSHCWGTQSPAHILNSPSPPSFPPLPLPLLLHILVSLMTLFFKIPKALSLVWLPPWVQPARSPLWTTGPWHPSSTSMLRKTFSIQQLWLHHICLCRVGQKAKPAECNNICTAV